MGFLVCLDFGRPVVYCIKLTENGGKRTPMVNTLIADHQKDIII